MNSTNLSLIERIHKSGKPFTLFHTYDTSEISVNKAISENKSLDLDISVDDNGNPYLGHSLEFYKISGEKRPENNMPFDDAIKLISQSNIPVIVDCKDNRAWELTNEVISKIGAERCLVHIYATELKFNYNLYDHNYPSELMPIKLLTDLKHKFPSVTTTASCKFLPEKLLVSSEYKNLLLKIRQTLSEAKVDTVCLNVPDSTMSNETLRFFQELGVTPHINIDNIDTSIFSELYVGETDNLSKASNCSLLGY